MQAGGDDINKNIGTILVYPSFKRVGGTENEFADTFEKIRIRRQRAAQVYARLAETLHKTLHLKHVICIGNMEYVIIEGRMSGQKLLLMLSLREELFRLERMKSKAIHR
jgi:hypothetical protein